MKIAIRFHDNDFYNTFTQLLETLHRTYLHTGYLPTDKELLLRTINRLSYEHYLLFQSHFNETDCERLRDDEYFNISIERLLIDDEVDSYLAVTDWDNGETFILDTSLFNNNIYSI